MESLQNPSNFQKFADLQFHSPYGESPYQKCLREGTWSEIGLDFTDNDDALNLRIRRFVDRYAWQQMKAYYVNRATPFGEYHIRGAAKTLATQAVAGLIGLEDLIPYAQYMNVTVSDAEDRCIFGVFMDKALGVCAMDIPGETRRIRITPEFQRALLNLNLLDVITHEQDHSPNNYNVVMDENGQLIHVSAYDNNGLGTFSLKTSIDFQTYKNCSSFIREDGTINRPCLDKRVVENILTLKWNDLYKALTSYVSKPIILCTWTRIRALKRAIMRSVERDSGFLLSAEEFSERTIEIELDGTFGKTYLNSFLQDCLERSQYQ